MRTFVLAAAIAAAAVVPASSALASTEPGCPTVTVGDPTTVCVTYRDGCVVVWTNQLQTTKPIEVCPA